MVRKGTDRSDVAAEVRMVVFGLVGKGSDGTVTVWLGSFDKEW
jgi:hypothetical protein